MGEFLFYTRRKILRLVARCEYHIENFLGMVQLACLQLLLSEGLAGTDRTFDSGRFR
jgi:hypothetical protein